MPRRRDASLLRERAGQGRREELPPEERGRPRRGVPGKARGGRCDGAEGHPRIRSGLPRRHESVLPGRGAGRRPDAGMPDPAPAGDLGPLPVGAGANRRGAGPRGGLPERLREGSHGPLRRRAARGRAAPRVCGPEPGAPLGGVHRDRLPPGLGGCGRRRGHRGHDASRARPRGAGDPPGARLGGLLPQPDPPPVRQLPVAGGKGERGAHALQPPVRLRQGGRVRASR